MSTIRRRTRQRLNAPESLEGIWDAGLPPPDWAFLPGDHHEALSDLVFFSTDAGPFLFAQDHPHHAAWVRAMRTSKPSA